MPWVGGSFIRTDGVRTGANVWSQAEAAGIGILSADADTHDQDLAEGINACMTRDGASPATGDINMGGHRLTLLGAGSALTDAMQVGQFFRTGDTLISANATPPIGWSIDLTKTDMTLKVVATAAGGTGGTGNFSAVFTSTRTPSGSVGSHVLTASEMPIHGHAVNDPGHDHPYHRSNKSGNGLYNTGTSSDQIVNTDPSFTGITVGNAGGGLGHDHTLTLGDMDFNVKYLNVNVIVKD